MAVGDKITRIEKTINGHKFSAFPIEMSKPEGFTKDGKPTGKIEVIFKIENDIITIDKRDKKTKDRMFEELGIPK